MSHPFLAVFIISFPDLLEENHNLLLRWRSCDAILDLLHKLIRHLSLLCLFLLCLSFFGLWSSFVKCRRSLQDAFTQHLHVLLVFFFISRADKTYHFLDVFLHIALCTMNFLPFKKWLSMRLIRFKIFSKEYWCKSTRILISITFYHLFVYLSTFYHCLFLSQVAWQNSNYSLFI